MRAPLKGSKRVLLVVPLKGSISVLLGVYSLGFRGFLDFGMRCLGFRGTLVSLLLLKGVGLGLRGFGVSGFRV